jgi:predicted GNAT family N-acyltransferase
VSAWAPRLVVCPPERLTEMFRLRCAVWIGEGADPAAFPGGEWRDERDASRLHWIVLNEDRVVATASLSVHSSLADVEEGEVYVRAGVFSPGLIAAPARVTVAAECRGRFLAQKLLDVQDAAALEAGATLAVRQASPAMRRLLERRGWREHGPGPWDARFPGVPFTVMSLLREP